MKNNLPKDDEIPLNPGIVKTVLLLREHGFLTTDSGDGRTHACECDADYGYVAMRVEDPSKLASEATRLLELLQQHGVDVQAQGEDPEPTFIQASFDPVEGTPVIVVVNITDDLLKPLS